MYLSDPAAPVCPEQKDLFVYLVSQVVPAGPLLSADHHSMTPAQTPWFWHNKTKTKAINAEKTKCRDRL